MVQFAKGRINCLLYGKETQVVDARQTERGFKRRKCCQFCGYRYNTIEMMERDEVLLYRLRKIMEKLER